MRNLAQILSLVFASSATAYLPFTPPQQPFEASSSQKRYDGHQVWRLEVTGQSRWVKDDIREAINVSLPPIHLDSGMISNWVTGP